MKKILIALVVFLQYAAFCNAQTFGGGNAHSLVICADNTVQSFGNNYYGQLGNGTFAPSFMPVAVSSLTNVIEVVAGRNYSVALKSDGTVWTWGENYYGQLGNGTNINSNVPVQVTGLSGVISIAAGDTVDHTLALKNDGTVWAWGYNGDGELGNGTNITSNIPVQVTGLTGVISIAGSDYSSFALKSDGTVWVWGYNGGLFGNGTATPWNSNIPILITSISGVAAIASESCQAIALRTDGSVWAWGCGACTPSLITSLSGITNISCGWYGHSMALKSDGTVWAWGANDYGQLGNGTNIYSSIPVQVSSLSNVRAISACNGHSFAQKYDGTFWAWGSNASGKLGTGTSISSNLPVQITITCPVAIGIDEITEQNAVVVYPNPSSGQVSFDGVVENNLVEVMDITGRLIKSETFSVTNHTIDLSSYQRGIYIYRIIDEQGRSQQGKLILQ